MGRASKRLAARLFCFDRDGNVEIESDFLATGKLAFHLVTRAFDKRLLGDFCTKLSQDGILLRDGNDFESGVGSKAIARLRNRLHEAVGKVEMVHIALDVAECSCGGGA